MSYIRIEYDDQPEEIVTKFQVALEEFGITVKEELQGDGYVKYEIEREEDESEETST